MYGGKGAVISDYFIIFDEIKNIIVMGFPTSSFKEFADACSEGRGFSRLDRFRLIAIVVHDPDNQDFINEINNNYAELNYRTGRDFVYITFCGIPDDYNPFHNEGIPPTENDADLIRLIQKQFNISRLPALIVTDSIQSNRYVTFESSIEEIFNQLIILGESASSFGRCGWDEDDMPIYCGRMRDLRGIGLEWEYTHDGRSIAEIMV